MVDTIFDWALLCEKNNQALRAEITNADYMQAAITFIQSIHSLTEREITRIVTDAQSQADVFWEQNRMMREIGEKKEQGQYGTRIRLEKFCFTAEWYRNSYRKSKSDKTKQPLSHYIPKGRTGYRYPKSAFASVRNTWEKDLINQIEDHYENLRIQAALLSEMRNLLRKYKTTIAKSYGTTIEK